MRKLPSLKDDFTRNVLTLLTGATIAQAIPVVVAPILNDLLETLIPDRLFIFFILIRSEYAASLNFIAGSKDMPPARKVALPVANFVASFVFVADLKLKFFISYAAAFFEPFFFKAFQTFSAVAGICIS